MKQKREDETELFTDKIRLFLAGLILVTAFSGCASHQDEGYYDRANKASEKALNKLDRE